MRRGRASGCAPSIRRSIRATRWVRGGSQGPSGACAPAETLYERYLGRVSAFGKMFIFKIVLF